MTEKIALVNIPRRSVPRLGLPRFPGFEARAITTATLQARWLCYRLTLEWTDTMPTVIPTTADAEQLTSCRTCGIRYCFTGAASRHGLCVTRTRREMF